ncbi:MAG: hypothetical protein KBF51_04280 [Chitinophagales bacterium]|nr:hypothetical protein [Chitinophagales bacterium]MBP9795103.1 hypothetical protein [Chitinophagales bacterium]
MSFEPFKNEEKVNLYFLSHDFFSAPDFIKRFNFQTQDFIKRIKIDERNEIRTSINVFYSMCNHLIIEKKDKIFAQQMFLEIFSIYANHFESKETFQYIINYYENGPLKSEIFGKFPYKAKYIYSAALFNFYQLSKTDNFNYKDLANILLKAKHRLLNIYTHFIDKKLKLTDKELGECLTLLSGTLAELSRWFEPIYYTEELEKINVNNSNSLYISIITLDAFKEKTCLSYNGLLLLKILEKCKDFLKDPKITNDQKIQIQSLKSQYLKELKKHKLKLGDLKKHKQENAKETEKFKGIVKYFVDNNLYLTEHAFYCNCKKATIDDLSITTNHSHTRLKWCDE